MAGEGSGEAEGREAQYYRLARPSRSLSSGTCRTTVLQQRRQLDAPFDAIFETFVHMYIPS